MKLAIKFPSTVEEMSSFASIAAMFTGAMIAVASPERAEELEGAISDVVVAEEASPPASDMHLSLYYQLATRALPEEALSPMARQDAARRGGYLAYQEGDYSKAKAELGWEPRTSFEQLMKLMVDADLKRFV